MKTVEVDSYEELHEQPCGNPNCKRRLEPRRHRMIRIMLGVKGMFGDVQMTKHVEAILCFWCERKPRKDIIEALIGRELNAAELKRIADKQQKLI